MSATSGKTPLDNAFLKNDMDANGKYHTNIEGIRMSANAATAIGYSKEIYIAVRTDGIAGTGTILDPLDGSTSDKIKAISTATGTNTRVHFKGAGPFDFDVRGGNAWTVKSGQNISGDGMRSTTIRMVGNMAGEAFEHIAFKSQIGVSNVSIHDLYIDCNPIVLMATADDANGQKNFKTGAVWILPTSNVIIERVAWSGQYGSLANGKESFGILVGLTNDPDNCEIRFCVGESPSGTYGAPYAMFGQANHVATNFKFYDNKAFGINDGVDTFTFNSGGLNAAYLKDFEVYNNTFADCYGIFYSDTGGLENGRIYNNKATRCWVGIGLVSDGGTKDIIDITDNAILVQDRNSGGNANYGIVIAGSGNGASATETTVSGNRISYDTGGSGGGSFWGLQVDRLTSGRVEDNLFSDNSANNVVGPLGVISGTPDSAIRVWNNRLSIGTGAAPRGLADNIDITSVALTASTSTSQHYLTSGTAPTIAAGAGAGTTPTVAISGKDGRGEISVTTGTSPTGSNATIVTITFNLAFSAAPSVSISAHNAAAAALSGATQVFPSNEGTTSFRITSGSSALAGATAYKWNYHVIG